MTRKSIIRPGYVALLVVVCVAAVAAVAALRGGGKSTLNTRHSVFAVGADDNISRVDIRDKDVTIRLTMDDSGQWMLNERDAADEVAVANMITILKALTVVMPVSVVEKQAVRDRLEKEGTHVDVFANRYLLKLPGNIHLLRRQKHIKSFIVGGMTQQVSGNYLIMRNADQPFVAHLPGYGGDIQQLFPLEQHRWLDPVIVDYAYDKIRRIVVDVPDRPEESFELVNDMVLGYRLYDASGNVLEADLLNAGVVERYLYAFEGLYYEDMIVDEASDEWQDIQQARPFIIITITDTRGHAKTLHCFRRKLPENHDRQLISSLDFDPDRFLIKLDDDRYALAQYMVFNRILRTLSFFMLPSS